MIASSSDRQVGLLSLRIEHGDGPPTVRASGEIDLATVDALEEELRRNCDSTSLTLDLGAVSFIDSSGICALVKAAERSHESGQELRILNVAGQVRRVLELCRLDDVLLA